ncbi:MAG TPA: 50S ribosomal protein L11 methyltransferase [Thermoanaerobaculia bacterium]|nr:50S ribosomal protein L11 methyltransferase [Thermoanaerobaculia bacterium]
MSGAIRFVVPAALADAVEENLFEGLGDVAFSASRGPAGDLSVWVEPGDAAEARTRLERLGAPGLCGVEEPPRDWVAAAAALRRSVVLGRYLLDPHDGPLATAPAPGTIRLHLPAARAFGTGSHESTRLAVRLLLAEPLAGRRVLDVGCGAGTLAFVAALEGARWTAALDLDLDAALATREHARANRVGRVGVFAGPLSALRVDAPFDVIVANMIQEEVAPLLPGIRRRLARGGRLLSAGLLVERRREWEDLLSRSRLRVVSDLAENEWLGTAAEASG